MTKLTVTPLFGETLSPFERRELARLKPIEWQVQVSDHQRLCRSEIFDYANPHERLRFFIRQIKDSLLNGSLPYMLYRAKLTQAWYDTIAQSSGIELDHLPRIPAKALQVPPIGALFPHDTSLRFIDGNHRIVRRWQLGNPFLRFIVVQLNALQAQGLVVSLKDEDSAVNWPITAPSPELPQ